MAKEMQYDLFGEPYCYDPDQPADSYFVASESTSEREYMERCVWCYKHIKGRYSSTVGGFTFRNEQDAFLFTLRWS